MTDIIEWLFTSRERPTWEPWYLRTDRSREKQCVRGESSFKPGVWQCEFTPYLFDSGGGIHLLSCVWLCDPVDCSKPGFPVLHRLLELGQTHVRRVGDAIQSSHPVVPFSCPQTLPASGSFLVSRLLASGGQSIGASASVLVLPSNIQSWFPLEID